MFCRRRNIKGTETVQCVFDNKEDLEEWGSLLKSVIEKTEELQIDHWDAEKKSISNMIELLEKKTFSYTYGADKDKLVLTWFPSTIFTLANAFFSLVTIQSALTTKYRNEGNKALKKYKELFSLLEKLNALPDKAIVSLK